MPIVKHNYRDLVSIAAVGLELRELTGRAAPHYGIIWNRVINGRIPALRRDGRWFVRKADLPLVARHFGLVPESGGASDPLASA